MNRRPFRPCLILPAVLLIVSLPARPARGEGKAGVPAITVKQADWGDADPDDIEAVCLSVAGELLAYFPGRKLDPIVVGKSRTSGPGVEFGTDARGQRRVA